MLRLSILHRALLVLTILWFSSTALARPTEQLLSHIPGSAHGCLIVPNLKSFSDQLTRMMEGMGRENLLLGSRPIDQLKSIFGLNVGIDDVGSAAIVLLGEQTPEDSIAVIVPVTDAKSFLEVNFEARPDGSYHLGYEAGGGIDVHAKSLGAFVAIARNSKTLEPLGNLPAEDSLKAVADSLGDQYKRLGISGEAFLLITQNGAASMKRLAVEAQQQFAGPGSPPIGALNSLGDVQAGMLVFDFDPLALVMRSLVRFAPNSALANVADQHEQRDALVHLPQKPFYIAASADVAGLGGEPALHAIAQAASWKPLPQWLTRAKAIEFAAYPSPLGLAGGLLNDSALFIQTDDPATTIASIEHFITDAPPEGALVKRQSKWESRHVEGVGDVRAFEVKVLDVPPELAQLRIAEQFMVGRSGWRGFVHQTPSPGGVIMTFSQRPAVLKAAIESAAAGELNNKSVLGSMAVIRAMRPWLPLHSDLQLYFGIGQFGALATELAQALGQNQGPKLPELDPELPPIGIGVDFFPGGIESSTVIPTGVLTPLLDYAMSLQKQSAPADQP